MISTKQPHLHHGTDYNKSTKGVLNGPRPCPLKIQKQSSSSSASIPKPKRNRTQKPVIIYTHSPKIIHTKAKDFMALVQKLTGLSHNHQTLQDHYNEAQNPNKKMRTGYLNESSHSDVVGDYRKDRDDFTTTSSLDSVSSWFKMPSNPYTADIPLFTPNAADLFCSPRPLFWFSDMMSSSPIIGKSFPPSFMEAMKGVPEY